MALPAHALDEPTIFRPEDLNVGILEVICRTAGY